MIRFDVVADNRSVPMSIDFRYVSVDGRRMTIAHLYDDETNDCFVGSCVLDSRDRDNKEVARKTAMKNLMNSVNISREIRTQIWRGYFNRSPKYKMRLTAAL